MNEVIVERKRNLPIGFINFEDETNDKMIFQKKLYNYIWASLIKKEILNIKKNINFEIIFG